ncbi:MAG: hypothetical protein L0H63_05720 [Nitrococcus sp.]|nr:hypothetical protein [Nitrococcus sp.]
MRYVVSVAVLIAIGVSSTALAGDVFVNGYLRSDGTYVRPHVKSSPDNRISNNYGPSQSGFELMRPYARDYDSDRLSNVLDVDSDNDGLGDGFDRNPNGRSRSVHGYPSPYGY